MILKRKPLVAKKSITKSKINRVSLENRALTSFRTLLLSRHPSQQPLRKLLPLLPFRSLVRLGSTTIPTDGKNRVEINSVQGVRNSSSKLLMKQCFTRAGVKTALWFTINQKLSGYTIHLNNNANTQHEYILSNLPYPIVAKSLQGSRGEGNFKLDNQRALEQWMQGKTLSNYIFEKFYTYSKEYRLHVTKNGCFYTCRKLIKNDAPEGTWQRHDDVCTWILENNPKFMKPNNWNTIVADCVNAQKALGLDICAFDVMVQGTSKINPEWIICESCSAPSFGPITLEKYVEVLPRLIKDKKANG